MHCSKGFCRKLIPVDGGLRISKYLHIGRINCGLREGISETYDAQKSAISERLRKANKKYEKFVGLVDVQEAQKKVKQAEAVFLAARSEERAILREMVETRERLKHVRERLSHVDYSNPIYLQLASDQHELVNEEERQKRQLEEAEDHERDSFVNLSNAMRESYEQERARVERTKNWSIIGTVIGTLIGMLGSIYMNRMRTKDLMKAVKETGNNEELNSKLENLSSTTEEKQMAVAAALGNISEVVTEMSNTIQVQNMEVLSGLVTEPITGQSSPNSQQRQSKPSQQSSIHIDALTEEIGQYNEALIALSNAVSALSAATPTSSKIDTQNIQSSLEKIENLTVPLQAKIDDIISAANNANVSQISSTLQQVLDKLNIMNSALPTIEEAPVIYELPDNADKQLRLQDGVKDVVLWGAIMCGLYFFIKF